MNKKVMALAVAGALGAPLAAHAQSSNFQIYGVLDLSAEALDYKSTTALSATAAATAAGGSNAVGESKRTDLYSQSSRIGFRGTEDLGGGLKAWFQVESGVDADGRKNNNSNDAGFGSRNTGVGLQGGWGQFLFGNWDSPYKTELVRAMNPYGNGWAVSNGMILGGNADSTGSQPNVGCDNTFQANGTVTGQGTTGTPNTTANTPSACQMAEGNGTTFHRRLANVIQYWTPNMGGFSGRFAYQTTGMKVDAVSSTTNVVTNDPKLYSLSGLYDAGPLALGLVYEVHQGFRATGTQSAAAAGVSLNSEAKDTGTLFTASWDFKVVKLQFAHEQLKYGDTNQAASLNTTAGFTGTDGLTNGSNGFKRKADFLGLSAPVGGSGKILAAYAKTKGNEDCGSLGVTGNDGLTPGSTAGNGRFFCGSATGAKSITLGYEHALSKRTKLYTTYMKVDNKSLGNFQPIVNKNSTAGLNGAIATGQDIVIINAGIQHAF